MALYELQIEFEVPEGEADVDAFARRAVAAASIRPKFYERQVSWHRVDPPIEYPDLEVDDEAIPGRVRSRDLPELNGDGGKLVSPSKAQEVADRIYNGLYPDTIE